MGFERNLMLAFAKHCIFIQMSVNSYVQDGLSQLDKISITNGVLRLLTAFHGMEKCALLAAGLKEVRNAGRLLVLGSLVIIRGDL